MKSTTARVCLFLLILFCLTLSSTRPSQSAVALVVAPNTPDVSLLPHRVEFFCGECPNCPERGSDVSLKNLGDTAVTVTSVKIIPPPNSGVWDDIDHCPRTLEAGEHCEIGVHWNGWSGGAELDVRIKGLGSPKTVYLNGAACLK
jgi:hypothetical protein